MEKKHKRRLTGWGDHITSTVSVMLVLFILGLVAVVNISFDGVSRQVKERTGFTVVLVDSVGETTVEALQCELDDAYYVSSHRYISAYDVMLEEAGDQGEELVSILGVNPYAPMIEVFLKADYVDTDSVAAIVAQWSAKPEVDEVTANTEMIESLNRNATMINTVLVVIAAVLLLISYVLINNTVRLSVYARRFLIHTMKLVGATGAFIRRPFMWDNALMGFVAGVCASGMLAILAAWAHGLGMGIESVLGWKVLWIVFAGMIVFGVAICMIAALISTNIYLRKDYDDMFN